MGEPGPAPAGQEALSERARAPLPTVFDRDDPRRPAPRVVGGPRNSSALSWLPALSRRRGTHRRILKGLVDVTPTPQSKRLLRTVKRWWNEIEVLITAGTTTAKVEASNTAIKKIKRTGRGFRSAKNYRSRILLRSAAQTAA